MILKFKNEKGVTAALIESQTAFSEHLAENGIPTARFYRSGERYVLSEHLHGYDVLITLENFCPGEITCVTPDLAGKTGRMLAMTHDIAEREDCHVDCPVLFDFFSRNDLFSYEKFEELSSAFTGEDAVRCERIREKYRRHLEALALLKERPRYAVQGDISCCNLFLAENGETGLFDFNRCGDNILFCDAVMQGVFESRLMDYDHELTGSEQAEMLSRFLQGYGSVRPFSLEERSLLPHMTAVINAFWLGDLDYTDDSLAHLLAAGKAEKAAARLKRIEQLLG